MATGWRDDTRSPWEDDRNRDRQRYRAEEPFEGEDFDRDFADYGPFRGDYPPSMGQLLAKCSVRFRSLQSESTVWLW